MAHAFVVPSIAMMKLPFIITNQKICSTTEKNKIQVERVGGGWEKKGVLGDRKGGTEADLWKGVRKGHWLGFIDVQTSGRGGKVGRRQTPQLGK